MKPVGTVITTEESPSTSEFSFVFDPEERAVKKGQYVQTDSEQGTVFGYIAEIFRSNRYFERAESVAEYERVSAMKDNFPTTSWEYIIAQVKVLGVSKDKSFLRASIPPVPGAKVFSADEELLKSFLGLKENGLLLGKIQHHNTEARIDLTRLIQKHLAILAMSGAGKSHLATVLIEELLDRKKEDGRIAVIVIDIHGEYMGFAEGEYANRTKIVEVGHRKYGFSVPMRKIHPEMIEEWLPVLSHAQRALLHNVLLELRERYKSERKAYGTKELMAAIDSYSEEDSKKADRSVKPALKRSLKEILRMHILSQNRENPKLAEAVKPGSLLILDFSDVDNLRKKQVIVSLLARKLFRLRKNGKIPPFLLVVEEAHNFAKEKAEAYEAVSRSVIETIAREGRKFGASLCLITQRPVNLSTTALSQCVTPDTYVELNPGNPTTIGELEKNWQESQIISYDASEKKLKSSAISNYLRLNPKLSGNKVYSITTNESGRTVSATQDHPFWVKGKGWVSLDAIQKGDKVAVRPQQKPYPCGDDCTVLLTKDDMMRILPPTINRDCLFSQLEQLSLLPLSKGNKKLPILARLIGHIFGDGTLHPPYLNPEKQHLLRITYSGKKEDLIEIQKDISKLGFSIGGKICSDYRESACNFEKYGIRPIRGTSTYFKTGIVALWTLLRALGTPMGDKSRTPAQIPAWLMDSPKSIQREFLAAYCGSEAQRIRMGAKSAEQVTIPLSKAEHLAAEAEKFCNDIQSIFARFGVSTSIYSRPYAVSKDGIKTIQYCIWINRARNNLINFCRNIGYRYSPEKDAHARIVLGYQEMLQKRLDNKESLLKKSKNWASHREISKNLGITTEEAKSLMRTKKQVRLPANFTPSFVEWAKDARTDLGAGLIWETVNEKMVVDASDVRDITVPGYHSFFANGFLTHNCNTHIILRVTNPNDLDHIQQSSEGIDARISKSITSLRVGEGIIVGEATNAPIFVDIRNIKTRKREKGKPLAELAAEYENMQEKKEEDAEAFL